MNRDITEKFSDIGTLTGILLEERKKNYDRLLDNTVYSGYTDIDRTLNGFYVGSVNIFASRNHGHTLLPMAISMARNNAVDFKRVTAILTMNDTADKVCAKIASAEAFMPYDNMVNGDNGSRDGWEVTKQLEHLHNAPLFINDDRNLTLDEISDIVTHLKKKYDLSVVFIDDLRKISTDLQQGNAIIDRLRDIATECKVAIFVNVDCMVPDYAPGDHHGILTRVYCDYMPDSVLYVSGRDSTEHEDTDTLTVEIFSRTKYREHTIQLRYSPSMHRIYNMPIPGCDGRIHLAPNK